MDKIIMVAAVVAVIAVLGVSFFILGSPAKKAPATVDTVTTPEGSSSADEPKEDDAPRPQIPKDNISYVNGSYICDSNGCRIGGSNTTELTGDCKLYKHAVEDRFECFGTAGNYKTYATSDWNLNSTSEYFCKPTLYGCKLYQRVEFKLT